MNEIIDKNIEKKNIIKSVFIFLTFYLSSLFAYIPINLFNINVEKISLRTSTYLSVFTSIVVLIIIFIVYWKDLIKDLKIFFKDFRNNFKVGLKYWGKGLLIMFVSNLILLSIFKSGGANNEKVVQNLISASPIAMGFYTCLLAPFIEEIVFRKTLKDVFKNKWVFVFCSFLIFGGAHVVSSATNFIDYLYIIPYGALGATFAYAYHKTDTVYTTVLFHIIHNSLLFFMSILV